MLLYYIINSKLTTIPNLGQNQNSELGQVRMNRDKSGQLPKQLERKRKRSTLKQYKENRKEWEEIRNGSSLYKAKDGHWG